MTRQQLRKGETLFDRWVIEPGDPIPRELRDMVRVPVAVKTDCFGVVTAQRLSVSLSAPDEPPTTTVELWTVDKGGTRTERIKLRCAWCGHKASAHQCRRWRIRYRKTGEPMLPSKWYCDRECKAKGARK